MRRMPVMIMVAVALAAASRAFAGGVVISMPAPPPAAEQPAAESETPGVGAIALNRYGHRRTSPRWNGSDFGFGAWNWRGWGAGWGVGSGWGWGRARGWGWGGWGSGGYFPQYRYHGFGGYRISLGQQFFARRAWNGGYVRPGWAWAR